VTGPRTIFDLAANKGTNKFTFFNFETGKEVLAVDSNTVNWHIAFSGTTIIVNGGTKGPGSVSAQLLTSTSFVSQTEAPQTGYDSYSFSGSGSWYQYYAAGASGPHTVVPIADKLIAVKIADGKYVKVQMVSYYKGAPLDVPTQIGSPTYTGISKYISFRYLISDENSTDWSQLLTRVKNLNSNYSNYNFFNLALGDTIPTADSNSVNWNIAFKKTTIIVNSGLSGPSHDSAQVYNGNFNNLNISPIDGWDVDDATAKAIPTGSGNGWYNYNPTSHTITPISDRALLIKLSNGRYLKLIIESYYKDKNPQNTSGYYSFSYYFDPLGTTDVAATLTSETTGIHTFSKSNQNYSIYPNPVSQADIQISTTNTTPVLVVLVDAQGQEVYRQFITEFTAILSTSTLKAGVYQVMLYSGDVISTQKLVVY
jgi:hypothetical protein